MFDKNYKEAMDNIVPNEDVKERILDKIELKEELKRRKNPAIPWRIAFACFACVAIVLGVVFVPGNSTNKGKKKNNVITYPSNNSPAQTLMVSKSYDDIYELIKKNNKFSLYEYVTDYIISDDEAIYETDMDILVEESMPSTDKNKKPGATMNGSSESKPSEKEDFSETTEQVEGVSEADIVKTDGEYIYYLKGTNLSIFKADGENSTLLSKINLSKEYGTEYGEMFLKDDRIIILQTDCFSDDGNLVSITIYDVSDPKNPKQVAVSRQKGWYNSSRMVGDYLYLVSNCSINTNKIDKEKPTTFVPYVEINDVCKPVPADSIYCYDEESYENRYTVIGAFNYKDGELIDTASILGGTDQVYCSTDNILLTKTTYNDGTDKEYYVSEKTVVSKLAINKGQIEYKTSGEVDGTLENQFFMDEHNGYFRFVTTVRAVKQTKQKFENTESEVVSYSSETSAHLTVLDSELEKVGEIGDLAKGERVYSVRFMGDIAYFVTFRQTDPLFSADLSDPKNPKILGELKIPGFSEYMYPYGDGLLLGFGMDADEQTGRTKDIKLSMFNINDPANVTEQNKTLVEGCIYSPALYNHKAMMVNPTKNLIGFATTSDYNNIKYMIYEYTGNGFNCKSQLEIKTDYKYAMDDIRGLFIGEEFYVVSKDMFYVFDINEFTQIKNFNF